ncbi:DUF438 domain-containing protein [Agathobacter sp.]
MNSNNIEKIKSYLKRLDEGENLESVRADFKIEFRAVDASEIMEAEQQLLKEGTPLEQVQRLCDVHSALFHGSTNEEQIANAEKAVAQSIKDKKLAATAKLIAIKGHPLYTFTLENNELAKVIAECKKYLETDNSCVNDMGNLLGQLRGAAIHYAKKGDLLYPHLKVKYGVSGPSDVMWTVDDEIRDELAALSKAIESKDIEAKSGSSDNHKSTAQFTEDECRELTERFATVVRRLDEMIYKEANILFPNCTFNFTLEEWYEIYRDSKDYVDCFGVKNEVWEEAEEYLRNNLRGCGIKDGNIKSEIMLGGGHMTVEQLDAMLNTIPLEISFVDDQDMNRYFNEGSKVFKRPGMAIDREVWSCHPPKVEQQVRRIIGEFKEGTLDKVPVWMNKNGRVFLVTYMAVRDKAGKYLGTMELVQDMEFAKEYFVK